LFLPEKLPQDYQFRKGKEVKIKVEKKIDLSCYYNEEANSKGVILYLHGNKGSIRRCMHQSDMMSGLGYDVFMPDYRSYGKSGGQLHDENQMYSDIQKVYDYLKSFYKEKSIVIVGYSIGTGMASYLAANNSPNALFLVSPYRSILSIKNRYYPIAPSFLVKYKFRNDKFLEKIKCPVSIFHAINDRVIPFDESQQLKQSFPDKVDLISLGDAGHRGSIFSNKLKKVLKQKLK